MKQIQNMMNRDNLLQTFKNNSSYKRLCDSGNRVVLNGITESAVSLVISNYASIKPSINIVISQSKDAAAYFDNDLNEFNFDTQVGFFPSSYKKSILYGGEDASGVVQRISLLSKIKSHDSSKSLFISTYYDAINECVISKSKFDSSMFTISSDENIEISTIVEILIDLDFKKVDFVYEPGQFAVRGGIVDIFSFADNMPYRIDTFGDSVDSIRRFDIATQRSVEKVDSVSIVPNVQVATETEVNLSLVDFVKQNSSLPINIWIFDSSKCLKSIDDLQQRLRNKAIEGDKRVESIFSKALTSSKFVESIAPHKVVSIGSPLPFSGENYNDIIFDIIEQPSFNKDFNLLSANLNENESNGFQTLLLTHNKAQFERVENIICNINGSKRANIQHISLSLHKGFIDNDTKLALYTDHNIFERFFKYQISNELQKPESITISELNALELGDYVVHINHGIGIYGGIVKSVEGGKTVESIRLFYQNNDTLFVNVHSIHKISKYKDKDNINVTVSKLGSSSWQRLKATTKAKVKDIAKDLIALYAKRKKIEGFAFSKDTYLQNELEASFIYEDTPDQQKATIAVKREMEKVMPMDMLICGDVGYGKTEVAIRAAFKAATDSKQVAVLVPTTVLALQHYRSFSKRLRHFPVNIEVVSRAKTAKQLTEVANKLKEGKIDILIGTHKLLSSKLQFKDLGLLVIDEEQKFGVVTKEKLRTLKANVDTLTLTATPIPRTLQFSLMGARDLVVINTPPPNRQPVSTVVNTFDNELLKEALDYELSRNGQSFIIHNRVDTLYHMKEIVSHLCPNATIAVGHGQMKPSDLEKVMMDFIYGDIDIFISTTIVESGIDIPNANTIIINDAQNFGLSELHQLRGRVGRTNRKAYCYLFTPSSGHLTSAGARRLKAIEDFSDLGSGLNIAMQDLDIRGAGNILGMEQSGFITDMGYETFQKILSEAMSELKEDSSEVALSDDIPTSVNYINDCQIDTTFEAIIPDSYISNMNEKMRMYRSIDNSDTFLAIDAIADSMVDRFGQMPDSVVNLLGVVKIRKRAIELGIEKVILKNGFLILHFVYKSTSKYYNSDIFHNLMKFISMQDENYKFKIVNDVNLLSIKGVDSVNKAVDIVSKMYDSYKNAN